MWKAKLLEDNMGDYCQDLMHGISSFRQAQKVLTIKEMMDKFDYIKIGNIHSSKIPLREWSDEPKNERKYMQYINNQALMSRIYKEHLPINKTKMDHPTEKWANDLNRYFRRRNQSGQNQKVFNCISNQGNANQNYMKNYNTKYWPECGTILIHC